MYELVPVSERCYYINCPAKMGVYLLDRENVCLIDSGNDKDAGKKVKRILDQNGWHLTAILNTHSNADHIGGNRYLQSQTGCKIYSGGIEAAFTRFPVLMGADAQISSAKRPSMTPSLFSSIFHSAFLLFFVENIVCKNRIVYFVKQFVYYIILSNNIR